MFIIRGLSRRELRITNEAEMRFRGFKLDLMRYSNLIIKQKSEPHLYLLNLSLSPKKPDLSWLPNILYCRTQRSLR
jgi:hypothetical protein